MYPSLLGPRPPAHGPRLPGGHGPVLFRRRRREVAVALEGEVVAAADDGGALELADDLAFTVLVA